VNCVYVDEIKLIALNESVGIAVHFSTVFSKWPQINFDFNESGGALDARLT